MWRRHRRIGEVVFAVAVCTLLFLPTAQAAFEGANGKIAFTSTRGGNTDIYVMNADGTGVTRLTTDPEIDIDPAWSPDGTKIAFSSRRNLNPSCLDTSEQVCNWEIYVMNADGSNETRLTHDTSESPDTQPAWTQDGTKITIAVTDSCTGPAGCTGHLATLTADGTPVSTLYLGGAPGDPAWSPDGTRLAYTANFTYPGPDGIYTVNPDGTDNRLFHASAWSPDWAPNRSAVVFASNGVKRKNVDGTGLATLASRGNRPVWSPDSSNIAFDQSKDCTGGGCASNDIWVMNADGAHQVNVTNNPSGVFDIEPDWQPTASHGYPRPKGATPFQTYLTVAYKACLSANRQHGPPLAALSCSPPVQTSSYLTVGTLDSNQNPAKSVGQVRMDVRPGNASTPADEADVNIFVSIKDVRLKADLSDYAGELQVRSMRRITDKDNGPSSGDPSGTANDGPFTFTVPCSPTADTTIGSLCALTTTADTLVPGQVKEEVRSIWQLSQVEVYDGGADGDADTPADNTLFMNEGIFVP